VTTALRRPAAAGVLVALVLIVGWWQLVWSPQGAAIASAHTKVQTESSDLFTVEQSIGHLKHLETIAPKLTALEKQLGVAAPTGDELDQFLLSLNGMAQQAGVTVSTLSVSSPTSSSTGLEVIQLHMSLSGDYFAVQRFLDLLRASTRIVIVDSLSESPNRSSAKGPQGGVQATLAAHILSGLTAPNSVVAAVVAAPPTTAPPTGIISGPVTKARNAVAAANAHTATVNNQANAIGGP